MPPFFFLCGKMRAFNSWDAFPFAGMRKKIAREQSPLKEAFKLLNASNVSDLCKKFIAEDQRLIKAQALDYKNKALVINKAKEIIERAIEQGFSGEKQENDDLRDVLWFWYHHATGYAIWRYRDKTKAREFSKKALNYQVADNPNKITRPLYLLVHDRKTEAEDWLKTISEEPEKTASQGIMTEFNTRNLFKS